MESAKWYIGRMHARERAQRSAERQAKAQLASRSNSVCSTAIPSPSSTWSTDAADFITATKSDQLAALKTLNTPKWSPGDMSAPLTPTSMSSEEAAEVSDVARGRHQYTALELLGRVAAMG